MKLVFSAVIILAAVVAYGAPHAADISDVAWLQGCWELRSTNTTIEEQWMAPRGNNMVGVSRTVRADSLVAFELVVIREREGGVIYEAHPSGQSTAAFRLVSVNDSSAVFENQDHDFPQRIGYRLCSLDSLVGWIEGRTSGSERRIEFPYRRVSCAGD